MEQNNLLQSGEFISHSGKKLNYKIDCDFLTDDDIYTVASIIASKTKFDRVIGIPSGGIRLQNTLVPYLGWAQRILIVDDVLTTGASMEEKKEELIEDHNGYISDIVGWVIFARGELPDWINAVFTVVED